MRVTVQDVDGTKRIGEFVGLTTGCDRCEDGCTSAVVRLDGRGMFLWVGHPSRVSMELDPTGLGE